MTLNEFYFNWHLILNPFYIKKALLNTFLYFWDISTFLIIFFSSMINHDFLIYQLIETLNRRIYWNIKSVSCDHINLWILSKSSYHFNIPWERYLVFCLTKTYLNAFNINIKDSIHDKHIQWHFCQWLDKNHNFCGKKQFFQVLG